MKEKYEIEIHDKTARGIYVYIHESTSFYNAFYRQKQYKECMNIAGEEKQK